MLTMNIYLLAGSVVVSFRRNGNTKWIPFLCASDKSILFKCIPSWFANISTYWLSHIESEYQVKVFYFCSFFYSNSHSPKFHCFSFVSNSSFNFHHASLTTNTKHTFKHLYGIKSEQYQYHDKSWLLITIA